MHATFPPRTMVIWFTLQPLWFVWGTLLSWFEGVPVANEQSERAIAFVSRSLLLSMHLIWQRTLSCFLCSPCAVIINYRAQEKKPCTPEFCVSKNEVHVKCLVVVSQSDWTCGIFLSFEPSCRFYASAMNASTPICSKVILSHLLLRFIIPDISGVCVSTLLFQSAGQM